MLNYQWLTQIEPIQTLGRAIANHEKLRDLTLAEGVVGAGHTASRLVIEKGIRLRNACVSEAIRHDVIGGIQGSLQVECAELADEIAQHRPAGAHRLVTLPGQTEPVDFGTMALNRAEDRFELYLVVDYKFE